MLGTHLSALVKMLIGVIELKQPIYTPPIADCYCSAKAKLIDWNFCGQRRVMCDNNHTLTGEFITQNRAVHKWNNKIKAIDKTP